MRARSCQNAAARKSDWQSERARRLHRLFSRIEADGAPVARTLRNFCSYWHGKIYRTDPARRTRLGYSTVRRLYYLWLRDGRSPQAVALHFHSGIRRIGEKFLAGFIRYASKPRGRLWLFPVWREYVAKHPAPVCYGTALRYFSAKQFKAIQTAYAQRDAANRQARRLRMDALALARQRLAGKRGPA
jgi:hypothetical protein